jgi:very-short-patch-repair endonuclease
MHHRFLKNNPILKQRRQLLRNNATPAEKMLWSQLKENQTGYKFRRQYSFGTYILDFYCPQHKLGIEIDGNIHFKKQDLDMYRTRTLSQYGITIIRFTNDEVEERIEMVLEKIKYHLQHLSPSK